MRLVFVVILVALLNQCDASEWRQVHTAQGDVRGRKDPDGGLYSFYNIPYATVPTGPDKYKAPLPGPVWLEPLDAVDKKIVCLQPVTPFMDVSSTNMQEDCLVANVFVPDTEEKNLPVLVIIHGGGFEIGYGDMISPKNFVRTKKIIVVNFNYRLGVHGFLCLGSKAAPGNAGLKDQVAALRWVKRNIANFGGNPDDITVSGGSAGSMSTHLLALSKSAEGLFTKVIPESGADISTAAFQLDPLDNAKTYARMLNFTDVDDFKALEEFYKSSSLKSIIVSAFANRQNATLLFAPCMENGIDSQFIFNDYPVNIIKKGKYKKVPTLIGVGSMEGTCQLHNFDLWKDVMNEKFSDFLPGDLEFPSEEEKEEVSKKVKKFYFGDQPVGDNTILSYIDYFGDIIINFPTWRSVKLHVEAGHDQIYLYEYSFVDDSTPVVPHTDVRGAGHCAQTAALLDGIPFVSADESKLSEEYKQMKLTIRDIWYNFAVNRSPIPQGSSLPAWPSVGADGSPYMSLGKTIQLGDGTYLLKRAQLWDDIYEKYYKAPVPPPKQERIEL